MSYSNQDIFRIFAKAIIEDTDFQQIELYRPLNQRERIEQYFVASKVIIFGVACFGLIAGHLESIFKNRRL